MTDPMAVPTAHSSAPTDCRIPDPSDAAADGTFGGRVDRRAGYSASKVESVLTWARKPADLRASEVAVLVGEIDRLRAEVKALEEAGTIMAEELRDAYRRADLS